MSMITPFVDDSGSAEAVNESQDSIHEPDPKRVNRRTSGESSVAQAAEGSHGMTLEQGLESVLDNPGDAAALMTLDPSANQSRSKRSLPNASTRAHSVRPLERKPSEPSRDPGVLALKQKLRDREAELNAMHHSLKHREQQMNQEESALRQKAESLENSKMRLQSEAMASSLETLANIYRFAHFISKSNRLRFDNVLKVSRSSLGSDDNINIPSSFLLSVSSIIGYLRGQRSVLTVLSKRIGLLFDICDSTQFSISVLLLPLCSLSFITAFHLSISISTYEGCNASCKE